MAQSSSSLANLIANRLEITQQERSVLKATLDKLDTKVEKLKSTIGNRPHETVASIEAAINQLERNHATTSQTNEKERSFMLQLKKLKERKKEVADQCKLQASLDELMTQRKELRKEMNDKDEQLDELYVGARKLKVASCCGCQPMQVQEQKVIVPEQSIPRIVGKGGINLKQVETNCKVIIDVDRKGHNTLRITGTEENIAAAQQAILTIASTTTEEFSPTESTIVCLVLDKAALAHEIESRHIVRIDISRAKKLCKINGLTDAVRAAISDIQAIKSKRIEIPIDQSLLPSIVGKGGSTIRALGEGNRVHIDVDRENHIILVLGFSEDVDRTAVILRNIIDENVEIEEVIRLDKHTMVGCIIGHGGQHIRSLQKEFNVQMRTDGTNHRGTTGSTETAQNVEKYNNSTEQEKLIIRGTSTRVSSAVNRVNELVANYHASTEMIEMSEDLFSLFLGKKGSRIASLRDKYPDAMIDVDVGSVRVHSINPTTRQAVRDFIEGLIASNHSQTIPMERDMGVLMKGPRGAETRSLLTTDLGLTCDILPEEGYVKLRGSKRHVEKGIEIIESFVSSNYFVDILCTEDDISTVFLQAAADSPLKALETSYKVELRVSRKEGSVRIRGVKSAVLLAKTAVEGLLFGDIQQSSQVFTVQPLIFQFLIGKGGSTLKRLEKESNAKIDILKSNNLVRVRSTTPAGALSARGVLLSFIDGINASLTIDLAPFFIQNNENDNDNEKTTTNHNKNNDASDQRIELLLETTRFLFGVELIRDHGIKNKEVIAKGLLRFVESARQYMTNALSEIAELSIILPAQFVKLINDDGRVLQSIRDMHTNVIITLSSSHSVASSSSSSSSSTTTTASKREEVAIPSRPIFSTISICGPAAIAIAARSELWRTLVKTFPALVISVKLPAGCLREMDSMRSKLDLEHHSGGAMLALERECSCAHLASSTTEVTQRAVQLVQDKLLIWGEKHATIPVEEYMLPTLVGKNGTAILGLQKELKVGIQLNRHSAPMQLEIDAPDKSILDTAMSSLTNKVKNLRRGHWRSTVSLDLIGFLIGKQGATITKIRSETGAVIELDRRNGAIEVNGDEDKVAKARQVIEQFINEHQATSFTMQIPVPTAAFPLVIGTKGSKASEISQVSGVKFDLDRTNEVANVKGTQEACQKAIDMIRELLISAGFIATTNTSNVGVGKTKDHTAHLLTTDSSVINGDDDQIVESQEKEADHPLTETTRVLRVPVGATPAMLAMARIQDVTISKSAARRKRRKQQLQGKSNGEDEHSGEDENDVDDDIEIQPPTESISSNDALGNRNTFPGGVTNDDDDDDDKNTPGLSSDPINHLITDHHHHHLLLQTNVTSDNNLLISSSSTSFASPGSGTGTTTNHLHVRIDDNSINNNHLHNTMEINSSPSMLLSSPGLGSGPGLGLGTVIGHGLIGRSSSISPHPPRSPDFSPPNYAMSPTARDYLDAETGSDEHFSSFGFPHYRVPLQSQMSTNTAPPPGFDRLLPHAVLPGLPSPSLRAPTTTVTTTLTSNGLINSLSNNQGLSEIMPFPLTTSSSTSDGSSIPIKNSSSNNNTHIPNGVGVLPLMTPSTENLLSMLLGGTLNGFKQPKQQQQQRQDHLPSGNHEYSLASGNNHNNNANNGHDNALNNGVDMPSNRPSSSSSSSSSSFFSSSSSSLGGSSAGLHHQSLSVLSETPHGHANITKSQQQQQQPKLPSTFPAQHLAPSQPQPQYQRYQQQSNTNHYQSKSGLSVRL